MKNIVNNNKPLLIVLSGAVILLLIIIVPFLIFGERNVKPKDKNFPNYTKIKIDKNQPQSKRQAQFLKQVGNPYMLRRGSMMIKVSFANNGLSMEQAFENLLLNV